MLREVAEGESQGWECHPSCLFLPDGTSCIPSGLYTHCHCLAMRFISAPSSYLLGSPVLLNWWLLHWAAIAKRKTKTEAVVVAAFCFSLRATAYSREEDVVMHSSWSRISNLMGGSLCFPLFQDILSCRNKPHQTVAHVAELFKEMGRKEG